MTRFTVLGAAGFIGSRAAAILRGQLHLDAATRQGRAQTDGTRTARARLARLIDAGRVTQQR